MPKLLRFRIWTGLPAFKGSRVPVRALLWATQAAIVFLCGLGAFLLRFEFNVPSRIWMHLVWALVIWVVIKSAVFRLFSLDRGWWAHVSVPDVVRVATANGAASVLAVPLITILAPGGFPRSVYIIDLLLCMNATIGVRMMVRLAGEMARQTRLVAGRRAVIYGAGRAGASLLREIRGNSRLAYSICGFIDDDPMKRGMNVQLTPVLGCGADLPAIAARHEVEEVLIAISAAGGPDIARILDHCHRAGLKCKTIPSMAEVIEGGARPVQIRDVAVEDLLGRNPVNLDETAIRQRIQDKVVLVTGAAGSIGSELCRQIARFEPRALVGFEIAETALFHLEREMRASFPHVPFSPEIGSIQSRTRLAELFAEHRPATVFHAAAYKHVPLMEAHLFEAVQNNVLGTHNVARAAALFGADDFVMISSDKAVRPTNIMGLTKRIAEIVVRSLQNGGTKFVSVRFGNVLGSSGSVVPIFKQQIAAGGPVTVTDPGMRRYFMTIPEAAQLVLQASTMAGGGETFVLDMGQPVKIVDLARNLILLSGLRPDEDIKIEFTGIRPGEKLYEELSAYDEDTLPTFHEKIKIFAGAALPEKDVAESLEDIRVLCEIRDVKRLIVELKDLVPEYNLSVHVLRDLLSRDGELAGTPALAAAPMGS